MKLWLIEPKKDRITSRDADPWNPIYEKCFGFVIRAETEEEARRIATTKGEDEMTEYPKVWLDGRLTTCIELKAQGKAGVILRDSYFT